MKKPSKNCNEIEISKYTIAYQILCSRYTRQSLTYSLNLHLNQLLEFVFPKCLLRLFLTQNNLQ